MSPEPLDSLECLSKSPHRKPSLLFYNSELDVSTSLSMTTYTPTCMSGQPNTSIQSLSLPQHQPEFPEATAFRLPDNDAAPTISSLSIPLFDDSRSSRSYNESPDGSRSGSLPRHSNSEVSEWPKKRQRLELFNGWPILFSNYVSRSSRSRALAQIHSQNDKIPSGKRRLISYTGINEDDKAKVHAMCRKCGIRYTESISNDITHLVTEVEDGLARRTVKYSLALAIGAFVVGLDWVDASLACGAPVQEGQYEVDGDRLCKNGYRKMRYRGRADVLTGYTAYVDGHSAEYITSEEVCALAIAAGIQLVTSWEDLAETSTCITIGLELQPWSVGDEAVRPRVSFRWLLDCLSACERVPPENHSSYISREQ